jgi:hypothetical protein
MRKILLLLLSISFTGIFAQQPFSKGSIVVVRVGVPDSALPAASSPVFLEEFSPVGKHIQTISLPYEGEAKITLGGRTVTEGTLRRSANGKYLTFGGYNLVPGTSNPTSTSTGAERTIARIDVNGTVDVTTRLPVDSLYPNAAFRGVVTNDGTQYWTAGGTQGLRYVLHGANQSILISGTVTNMRSVDIQHNNLYLTHGSGNVNTRVMQVGESIPDTIGVTAAPMPGLPTSGSSGCDFFLADLNQEIPGPDVLYLADDIAGLRKFSLVEGTWVQNSITGSAGDVFRGLSGITIPGGALLYTTFRAGNQSSGGGQLGRLADFNGYNQPMTALPQVLATAETNTGFRGMAFAPVNEFSAINTYVFTGNGNWSESSNWQNGEIPPASLLSGDRIIIQPANDGVCILDIDQKIEQGAIFIVKDNKQLIVNGSLELK